MQEYAVYVALERRRSLAGLSGKGSSTHESQRGISARMVARRESIS